MIKRIPIVVTILALCMIVLAIPNQCIGQVYYEKGGYRLIRSHYDKALVDGLNVDALSKKYLPDFQLTFKLSIWYHGLLYAFTRQTDKQSIGIRVGVYPSVQEAEDATMEGLTSMAERLTEGPVRGEQIGDNYWYSEVMHGNERRLETIAFVKKNVFVILSSQNNIDFSALLLDLGKSIDNAITNGSSYITFSDTPSPPVVTSIQVSKNELRKGDTASVTFSASDPKGKKFEYQASFGVQKPYTGPENVFLIQVSDGSVASTYLGTTHTFEVWVVNEDNLFSKKKPFQITF